MNLVIGNTSQLAHYFPTNYLKISSRNVDLTALNKQEWEAVYLTFAEQRIYDTNVDYITPNYTYTMQIINALLECSQKIVCYTSCELWNQLNGYISVETEPNFYPLTNEYCLSKLLLLNKVKELRKVNQLYQKVILLHPFYFNSVYRNPYFLFGKVFNSIIRKEKINVGNLNFYRDMVHSNFVVKKSIELKEDSMIGSGKLFNVRDFIRDLYQLNGMKFEEWVAEDLEMIGGRKKLIMAKVNWEYGYKDLLRETREDILEAINKENRLWKQ